MKALFERLPTRTPSITTAKVVSLRTKCSCDRMRAGSRASLAPARRSSAREAGTRMTTSSTIAPLGFTGRLATPGRLAAGT
jgi:hypothetical protein